MSVRSQRGRPTPAKKQSLMPFYMLLAVVAVLGAALLAVNLNRASTSSNVESSGTANVDLSKLGSYPAKGDAKAPVTVVEFADYQCPGCAAYSNSMSAEIDKSYVDTGKVRFIYHELPIPSHQNAVPAAEAARAAGDQGKYWEMNKLLFARQNDWATLPQDAAKAKFGEYAKELGLNVDTFNQTLQSGKYTPVIQAAYQDAARANIEFTPSFVINGKIYSSNQFKAALDAALAGK